MFRKKIERIVSLGVPKEENESKWVVPSFARPKEKLIVSDY